jgi:hypothetical protein
MISHPLSVVRRTLRTDEPGRMRATHSDGSEACILSEAAEIVLAHGDEVQGMGWFAPAYGVVVPAWTARVARTEQAPITMVTWIGPTPPGTRPPSLERLSAVNNQDAAIAAKVTRGERTSVFLVRPGGSSSPQIRDAGGYQTDARVLHCMEDRRTLVRLDLIDAMHAITPGSGGLTITASEPVADMHISIDDGVLDLQASHAPTRLRVQGGAFDRLVSIHLNHRELPVAGMKHGDTVTVDAASWSVPVRDLLPSIA